VERAAPIPPHPGCAGRPSAWMAVPRGKVEPASATSARSFRKNASIASFSARAARRHAGRGGPRPRDRSPLLEPAHERQRPTLPLRHRDPGVRGPTAPAVAGRPNRQRGAHPRRLPLCGCSCLPATRIRANVMLATRPGTCKQTNGRWPSQWRRSGRLGTRLAAIVARRPFRNSR